MAMTLDPLSASRRIHDEYRRYLKSTFPVRRPDLASAFASQLDGAFALSRGPILQAAAPYATGASVRELVQEGVLADGFLELSDDCFPIDRPLYVHQEQAIRKAVSGRNLVVATGTGSGKTECFLLPIIDHLLRERESAGLRRPGVRALLLYPMNALANDQLKRLRVLLRDFPELTFSRYVGETPADDDDAEVDFRRRYPSEPRLANELLSRHVMQERPPHILLTNYAMLEYLLLRPTDSSLFDGPTGEHWRFIALDEVHVYSGAEGTEIAMLLRRVRDRVHASATGRLTCFGTSATLGRGEADYPQLAEFASALFDEPFHWDPEQSTAQDVIGAERKPLVRGQAGAMLDPHDYQRLRSAVRAGATLAEVHELTPMASDADTVPDYLADVLNGDARVLELQRRLEAGSLDLAAAATTLFDGPDAAERLVDLVDLGVLARHRDDDAPVLPARYHFFLRALEGAFLCLHPGHDAHDPALRLARHEQCPSCASHGVDAAMFELGVCRRCGAEYVIGDLTPTAIGQRFAHAAAVRDRPVRALLGDPLPEGEDDEDEASGAPGDKAVAAVLCPGCGAFAEGDAVACACSPRPRRQQVWLARAGTEDGATRRCLSCARRTAADPIYRFVTGSDAPVSVIATDLYQEIPAGQGRARDEVGQGRKLLTFSDSRQDAAFFAPFLERTYARAVQRRLLARTIERVAEEEPRSEDLVAPLVRDAEEALVLDPDDSRASNRAKASTWVMRELLALDRRQSLEGTGVAEIRIALPRRFEAPRPLLRMGFDEDECRDLVRVLLDTLRLSGAVSVLDGVDIRDEAFAPRNREFFVRETGSSFNTLAWSPGTAMNRRVDFLEKVLSARSVPGQPREILAGLWRWLTQADGGWDRTLVAINGPDGPVWRLAADRFEFLPGAPARVPLRCGRCQQLWWRTVAGVCPGFRCDGTLAPVPDPAALVDDHYARLYRDLSPIGMSVQEHTAQWRSSEASSIQDQFVQGRINVLSCSTTFELGVDVGEVQAVLLRNVPPTPANYVQRAGRAGRRTDSAALVVTYAQRRSHDLTYFDRPHEMVDGAIPAPRIVLDNVPIVRRHVHSIAFAAFQREFGEHRRVDDFFLEADDGRRHSDVFVEWLRGRPGVVGEAVRRVTPPGVADSLGLKDWSWVEALVVPTEDDPTNGWLDRAAREIREDVGVLDELMREAADEQNFGHAARLKRIAAAMVSRQLLSFLASRNVLPKYGFPVDVVELNLARSGDDVAARIELTRDLKLAIADYAPGAVTVAGKKLWRSRGLIVRQDRGWPVYGWAICDACGAFRHGLEEATATCPSCHSEATEETGRFAVPIYGFAGSADASPGETRPPRRAQMQTFFGSYRDTPPELEPVPELGNGIDVERRFSRQGRITVINKGPIGAGFRICEWCGYGEPVLPAKKAARKHKRVDRPNVECAGTLRLLQLGHEYLTDVLEVRVSSPLGVDEARSTLYALLEAAPAVDVARADIDATLHYVAANHPAFILFDAVPGGAGHTQRLGERLGDLVAAARARVAECECGPETSCYSCLRSYSNQLWHEQLRRGDALRVLTSLAGG